MVATWCASCRWPHISQAHPTFSTLGAPGSKRQEGAPPRLHPHLPVPTACSQGRRSLSPPSSQAPSAELCASKPGTLSPTTVLVRHRS